MKKAIRIILGIVVLYAAVVSVLGWLYGDEEQWI